MSGTTATLEAMSLSQRELISVALSLGARDVRGWSAAEERLVQGVTPATVSETARFRRAIKDEDDPLGSVFCELRSPEERRDLGATYTPAPIVTAMLAWSAANGAKPDRVVDPGAGSGRYVVAAGRKFEKAKLIGVEVDPLAAILARAHLAAAGLADRASIELTDYRLVKLDRSEGRTLFIGNPPYVRHHEIEPLWKTWLTNEARTRGLKASQLAGLHVHFFLATAAKARVGDFGTFITASEWLDVNYGSLVRELLLDHLGGKSVIMIEPTALPFADAATTGAITSFEIGAKPPSLRFRRVASLDELGALEGGTPVKRELLRAQRRWSHLTKGIHKAPSGYVELGELCRVHRGQVTGSNRVWIEGPHSEGLPESVMFPTVTKVRELFQAGLALTDSSNLRRVIDLPVDLGTLPAGERATVNAFLKKMKALGTDQGFVAKNRRAWWSVGLRDPAPILATYMARRPPAFVRNFARARHINIAHGLYPRDPLGDDVLGSLVEYLSRATKVSEGRTYAGGLTKFEPKEMERLVVPGPDLLADGAA
jgi:hypothetical protein